MADDKSVVVLAQARGEALGTELSPDTSGAVQHDALRSGGCLLTRGY